jgi:hypothetical protein
MSGNQSVAALLGDVCTAFPEIRPLMDEHEDFAATDRMEAFAKATTLAFSHVGDPQKAQAYLAFVSARLRTGTAEERKFLDAYYAEVLFWQAGADVIKSGWPLVPQNLKDLYLAFHGKPPEAGGHQRAEPPPVE